MSTDAEWEKWGRQDPYFGVITNPKFRRGRLDEAARAEFFESGRWHVQHVLAACRRYIDPSFTPSRVLDFGCGVGRTLVAFAAHAGSVVGLDVSASMLQEARLNCERYGLSNVSLARSDDTLAGIDGTFDLVHSAIVFQHIEPHRGRAIFSRLIDCLAPGGVGAIQVTYAKQAHAAIGGLPPEALSTAAAVTSTATSRHLGPDPEMQMNSYVLNHLFFVLQSAGIERVHSEFTDHGGECGVFLFVQKPHT